MALILASPRRLLPRWVQFNKIDNFDELNYISKRFLTKEENVDHVNSIEKWKEDNNLVNAIELCSSSIVKGCFEDAREAASFILENRSCSQSVAGMAQKILYPDRIIQGLDVDDRRVKIAILRKRIHQSPGSPILWVDIALEYSALGQNDKAERAIENALILTPHNRFVVRCAARFFVHINKIEKAHQVVKKYHFLKNDAWVLAVELSVSSIKKRPSKYLKRAKNFIGKIAPFHGSELAGALGVMETESGANKKALKYFKYSLIKPTNNSIAQAKWSKDKYKLNISLDDEIINNDSAHEAQLYKNYQYGYWGESIKSGKKWAKYEPYSTRAFMQMSYISIVCQNDYMNSIEYSKRGLQLDKYDFALLNNTVVAYALANDIENANEQFNRIKMGNLTNDEEPVYIATKGLLMFKRGNVNEGRELYNKAIDIIKKKNFRGEILAKLFWVREEILAKTPSANIILDDLKKKMKNEKNKDILALKSHVEKLASR